jgi:hypothetical protein
MDKQTIHQAFVKVCAGVENVKRDTKGQVGSQTYKYATIDAVLEVLHPLLKANGLALTQYVDGDALKAKLVHESGVELDFGSYNLGALDKHQARGSAITYGRRYQLCAIFGIAQEDDDGAKASEPKIARNLPTSGEKSAQEVFGGSKDYKKYYEETVSAINRMTLKEQAAPIRNRIARLELVEEQYAMNCRDALELKLDDLHLQG